MFSGESNWVRHTVKNRQCTICHVDMAGNGYVFTRQGDRLEGIIPDKFNECVGVQNG